MPWWSWIVIWIALIALSLLYVLLLGIRTWRGLSATVDAFHHASEALARYRDGAEKKLSTGDSIADGDDGTQGTARGAATSRRPGGAVFASPEQMRDEYTAAKAERVSRHRRVRVARRSERGQLQSWRDIELLD